MAGRIRRGTPISAGALVVLGVLTGLIGEVVSGYLEPLAEYRWVWLSALVGVTAGAVVLDQRVRKKETQLAANGDQPEQTAANDAPSDRSATGDDRPVRGLPATDTPPLRSLFHVPPRPPSLTSRPELAAVVAALRAKATGTVGVTTALVGAGGFGKTSLALLACHDRRVREFFSGGIIWVTIGRDRTTAQISDLLRGVCELLAQHAPQMTDPGLLAHHLADLLAGRGRVLLVVDDVWTAGQLEPFVTLAERVRVLVTTRNALVLPEGHRPVRVDALDDRVAAEVLTRGLPPMSGEVRRRLLALTGGWPLLLALVNARLAADVASGAGVDVAARQAITRLEQAGPAALDVTDGDQRSKAVRATIGYSTEVLTEVLQPQVRDRFFELGVFREDAEIPVSMVHLLWAATAGMDPAQAQQTCERLAGLSLITLRWADQDRQVVVLHDVIRAFLRSPDGLGDRRAQVNQHLVDHAGAVLGIGDGHWWRLPGGHFLWDHLAFHLAEAGRKTQLAELLADVRWLLARLANGGPLALEADLSLCQDARAVATRRVIARAGYLLGELESPQASESNRLAHLSVLPHIRQQLSRPDVAERSVLVAKWPLPESRETGLIRTLKGHTDSVTGVAIAPDGTWLATTSGNEVLIWRPDGHLIATLEGHTSDVNGVAIAPDGTWLASASDDETVRIWSIGEPATCAAVVRLESAMQSVAIAEPGLVIAAGDRNVYAFEFSPPALESHA